MISRRTVVSSCISLAVSPLNARAQSTNRMYRIVFTTPIGRIADPSKGDGWQGVVAAFLQGMRDLGYVEGRNLKFEYRSADGKSDQVAEIAAKILETPPDVIIAAGGGANEFAHAFKRLTRTVPIVMANSSDPVEQGLVDSLARPGGNITGFAGNTGPDFEAKRLQLLQEAAPATRRVAFLGLKTDWESPAALGVRSAADKLGITLLHAEHTASNYTDAFAFMSREKVQGLFSARNPWNFSNRRTIVEFAASQRIAAVYPTREFPEVGGLMSYGPSLADLYRRAAGHVDKILKGAKPADLPVEQPVKFELVVNLKTAGTLRLTMPPGILLRVDQVIE
jgi:putative tryptophan/tyrosine transport system substrate-binding protein